NTGTGDGTLRLDVTDNDSIQDSLGNPLGGSGAGNGAFTSGPFYTLDRTGPSVSGVSSTAADGAYKALAVLPLTVTFSENTFVTGVPQLALATGGVAFYASGSGTSTLTFSTTVGAGQNSPDLDYSSTGALTLSGGTLKDALGN